MNDNKKEKFFWADQMAEEVIKDRKPKVAVCASGITPSGTIHIGNFREVITTELVFRALKDKKKKARFIYSWDDYDRFRKVPANVPKEKVKEYEGYIGMPVSEVPSPFPSDGKKKSYAEYFEEEFEKAAEEVGIKPEFIRQSVMYKNCEYAPNIKKALDKREVIMGILNKYRKEPLKEDWYPIAVYCENCKKDFTKVTNAEGYEVEYSCSCGFEGKVDYRKKGIVKLSWRTDWPMRWEYEGVVFEPGGIDHSAPGGSFTTAKEISKEVFNWNPPVYVFYDWVKPKGGTEFSSSSGNAVSLGDVLKIYEPEVLRYIFAGTRPNKGFAISFDNDVIKIYEDFDELERKYYRNEANPKERRIYEMSSIKLSKKKPNRTSFRHLVTLVQIGKTSELSDEDKSRAERVINWLDKYAGEDMKFSLKDKLDVKLTGKEKEAMVLLKEALVGKDLSEEDLSEEMREIFEAVGMTGKEFFETAYQVILGKRKGPKLSTLIINAGKEKIIKLLEQVK